MATDVLTAIQQFVERLLSDHNAAVQYAGDPAGTLAAQGISDQNLDGVNIRQVVTRAAEAPTVPEHSRVALQDYSSGGGQQIANFTPPPLHQIGHTTVSDLQHHLNYVTNVNYEGDHSVTQLFDHSTHIDQSQHASGLLFGDVSFDQHNANAIGDHAAANTGDHGIADTGHDNANNTGDNGAAIHGDGNVTGTGAGPVSGATGDGSQSVQGSIIGQNTNGDGNAQVGGGSHVGPINTGSNSGVIAGGHVDDTVVGDHNDTANVHGPVDAPINFGGGAIENTTLHNVAADGPITTATGGGDATNISGNTLGHGSSIAGGHSSSSGLDNHVEDNSQHSNLDLNLTDIHAHGSNVNVAQDDSQTDQHLHQQSHYDAPQHALVLEDPAQLEPTHHDFHPLHP